MSIRVLVKINVGNDYDTQCQLSMLRQVVAHLMESGKVLLREMYLVQVIDTITILSQTCEFAVLYKILPDKVTSALAYPQCPSIAALSMKMQARQV